MRYRDLQAAPYGREEMTLHRQVEVLDENMWVVEDEMDVESDEEESVAGNESKADE